MGKKAEPPVPDGVIAPIVWFAAYHTGRFAGLMILLCLLIMAISCVSIVLSRDERGTMRVRSVSIEPTTMAGASITIK